MRNLRSVAVLGALLASSCGGSAQPAAAVPAPAVVAGAAPEYAVHEWGVLRGGLDDSVQLSGPFGAQRRVMVLEKPVLYVHRRGEGELRINATVQIPSGAIAEHWPLVPGASGPNLSWAGVRVVQGSCRGSRYPGLDEAPCLGQPFCEAAELRRVETQDGACLEYEGGRYNHLFYRATVSGMPSLPVTISRDQGTVTLHHRGADALPGQVIYWDGALASIAPAPSPGEQHTFTAPAESRAAALSSVAGSLASAGLTEQEVSAFGAAWGDALFEAGMMPAEEEIAMEEQSAPASFVLYLLSNRDAAALATLHFEPPPSAVRRAIVVVMGLES